MFTDPNIAMVGQTRAALGAPIVGRVSFEDQGRSRVMLQNRGRLNVYADPATGRFLGAEMIAPRAEHLAHLLAWAHQQGLTIDRMLEMPFYHPVIEEGVRTALRDASAQLTRLTQPTDNSVRLTPTAQLTG
jgi:dihydrolipoamide dehydrogenase